MYYVNVWLMLKPLHVEYLNFDVTLLISYIAISVTIAQVFSECRFILTTSDTSHSGTWGFIKVHTTSNNLDPQFDGVKASIQKQLQRCDTACFKAAYIIILERKTPIRLFSFHSTVMLFYESIGVYGTKNVSRVHIHSYLGYLYYLWENHVKYSIKCMCNYSLNDLLRSVTKKSKKTDHMITWLLHIATL